MREYLQLRAAFELCAKLGSDGTLITLVATSGSAFRRPGAQALVDGQGTVHGKITGGCHDQWLADQASEMQVGTQRCLTFSTEGDVVHGRTGCSGSLTVLLEKYSADGVKREVLRNPCFQRYQEPWVNLHRIDASGKRWPTIRFSAEGCSDKKVAIDADLKSLAALALEQRTSSLQTYRRGQGESQVFLHYCEPIFTLGLFGAASLGSDMAELVVTMGWEMVVLDPRDTVLQGIDAEGVICKRYHPLSNDDIPSGHVLDGIVLASHNLEWDAAMLEKIANLDVGFVGVVGSEGRKRALLSELEPTVVERLASRLQMPVGLIKGCHQPSQIALSIMAQVQAYQLQARRSHSLTLPSTAMQSREAQV